MSSRFPFSAIAGQDEMKRALLLTAVDPMIGGLLAFGDRGTGKSTAVRALAALLPAMKAIDKRNAMPVSKKQNQKQNPCRYRLSICP